MPKVPWDKSQYYIDEQEKTVWLIGSFIRAMALGHRKDNPVPGYKVKLLTKSQLEDKKNAKKE